MAHMNQQIRDRVATIIGALPFFSGRVYKMRSYALNEAKLPAAVVYTNSQSSSLVSIGFRTLQGLGDEGVRFLLFDRIYGLRDLHQDELALTAVFGVQAHDSFCGGAAAGEEVECDVV